MCLAIFLSISTLYSPFFCLFQQTRSWNPTWLPSKAGHSVPRRVCATVISTSDRIYVCHISIQSSGFTQILPHPYTHRFLLCKVPDRSSAAVEPSSPLILVKWQKPPMNHPTVLQGWPWKTAWKCPFLFPPWDLVLIALLLWQMGVEVVTSSPSWQLPFHKEACIQLEDFN